MDRTSSLGLEILPSRGPRLLAWGRSDCGQLGLGLPGSGAAGGGASILTPHPLDSLSSKDVTEAAGSAFHSAFVTGEKSCR